MKKIKVNVKFVVTFCVVVALVVLFDQLSKYLIGENSYDFLKGFISIEGGHKNTGAAWSMFSNATVWLIVISIIFLAALFVLNHFIKKPNLLYYISFSMIFGGAIGNLYDRIAFGYVRDFIKLDFMNFPIFNIADSFLCVGVVLFCIFLIFVEARSGKDKSSSDSK